MPQAEKLYHERADLYDLIYAKLDYAGYAARLAEILEGEGVPKDARVLETACGTGSYLAALRDRYRMTGLDSSEAMLAVSRRKNPGVLHLLADMTDFQVTEPFDAALCLFSSIGYVRGEKALARAAGCFARALRPGGVLVIEPWISREVFRPGQSWLDTYSDEAIKIARASFSTARETPDGEVAAVDFEWVISRKGQGLDRFAERHELWFCPPGAMERALRDAGLTARFEPDGLIRDRGLWIARHTG